MKTNQMTYTEINGIKHPNLWLPEQPNINIGKYGQSSPVGARNEQL